MEEGDFVNYYFIGFILLIILFLVVKQFRDKDKDYSIHILLSSLLGIGAFVKSLLDKRTSIKDNDIKTEYLEKSREERQKRIEEIEKNIDKKEKRIRDIEEDKEGTIRDIVEIDKKIKSLVRELNLLRKKNDKSIEEAGEEVEEGTDFEDDSDVIDYINDNFTD